MGSAAVQQSKFLLCWSLQLGDVNISVRDLRAFRPEKMVPITAHICSPATLWIWTMRMCPKYCKFQLCHPWCIWGFLHWLELSVSVAQQSLLPAPLLRQCQKWSGTYYSHIWSMMVNCKNLFTAGTLRSMVLSMSDLTGRSNHSRFDVRKCPNN